MAQETLNIAEMSTQFSVSHRTLRFYEDKGLLSPVRLGMSRHYTKRDGVRLKLILQWKKYGFALDEIRHLLDLYETDGGALAQAQYLRRLANTRREELEEERDKLNDTLKNLSALNSELTKVKGVCNSQTAA